VNCTIFAYGPTGTGKTHTMIGTDQEPGVMFRMVEDLFKLSGQHANYDHELHVCYVEIYNEYIRDLTVLKPE